MSADYGLGKAFVVIRVGNDKIGFVIELQSFEINYRRFDTQTIQLDGIVIQRVTPDESSASAIDDKPALTVGTPQLPEKIR